MFWDELATQPCTSSLILDLVGPGLSFSIYAIGRASAATWTEGIRHTTVVCGPLVLLRPQPRARSLTVFTVPVASVLTQCQEEVSRIPAIHPGVFKPNCDENGNYMPLQCYGSIGYCWCVFPNGTEVPHTRSRGHRNCSGKRWPLCQEQEGAGRLRGRLPPAHHGLGHARCPLRAAATQPCIHPLCIPYLFVYYYFSPYVHTHLLNSFVLQPFHSTHPCEHPGSSRSTHLISSPPPWPRSFSSPATSHCCLQPSNKRPSIHICSTKHQACGKVGKN